MAPTMSFPTDASVPETRMCNDVGGVFKMPLPRRAARTVDWPLWSARFEVHADSAGGSSPVSSGTAITMHGASEEVATVGNILYVA